MAVSHSLLNRWWVRCALALVLLVLVALPFQEFWLTQLGRYLVLSDPDCHGQVAVVLAGDADGHRILTAAKLARQGFFPKVLVDGPVGSYSFTEDQLAIPFAVKRGYPPDMFIPLPMEATSTKTEAAKVVQELQRRGWTRFALVTSEFHTRRAARIFRQYTKGTNITFCTVGAPTKYFTPETWWKSRDGKRIVFFEWSKTIAEWMGV